MYEWHGWATVRVTTGEMDDFDAEQAAEWQAVEGIRTRVAPLRGAKCIFDVRGQGGAYMVWTAGYLNHRPRDEWDPVGFMAYIGSVAPGSYGLLYTYDDDAVDEGVNEFRVYVLARGRVEERCDPFLSPIIPVVEDRVE